MDLKAKESSTLDWHTLSPRKSVGARPDLNLNDIYVRITNPRAKLARAHFCYSKAAFTKFLLQTTLLKPNKCESCRASWCVVRKNFLEFEMKLKSGLVWFDRSNKAQPSVEQKTAIKMDRQSEWQERFFSFLNSYRLIHWIAEYVIDSKVHWTQSSCWQNPCKLNSFVKSQFCTEAFINFASQMSCGKHERWVWQAVECDGYK